jgi:putative ABC transport system substrate-binding protein
MKYSNKITIFPIILLLFSLYACKSDKDENEVAILKYVTHPALDEMENAYYKRLDSLLNTIDEKWAIKKYNANANPTTASSIAKSFMQKNVNHIFTIATPSAIAVSKNTTEIPHIYGAVADPEGANIIPSNRSTGIANAGENIIRDALTFIKAVYGQEVRIGTIYNPQEQNSIYIQKLIKEICADLKLDLTQTTVQNTGNLNSATNALCKKVDIIYSANDNTVNSGVKAITSVSNEYNIPFIIGDLSTLNKGALFAIGLEYKSMGQNLADISFEIIKGKSISSFPPKDAPSPEIWFNKNVASKLKYTPNDSLIKLYSVKIK